MRAGSVRELLTPDTRLSGPKRAGDYASLLQYATHELQHQAARLSKLSSSLPGIAARTDLGEWWTRLRPWLLAVTGLALTASVGLALQHLLREVHVADVMAAMKTTPTLRIAAAIAATAFSYLALTRYDASALRYVGARVANSTVLLTSFVAYALSNTIGLGPLSGGVVRMRLYSAAGLEPTQIARVIVFNAAAFGLGMLPFGAVALLWGAGDVAPMLHAPDWLLRIGAVAMLLALAAFLWLCARRSVLRIGRLWRMQLPPAGLALRQLAISAIELAASASVLWFLLPEGGVSFPVFIAFYAIAITAGIISHVPGGVGVFETIMLLAAGHGPPRDAMLGALLLNRGIYYVLPLIVATAMLIVYELHSGVVAPMGRIAVRLESEPDGGTDADRRGLADRLRRHAVFGGRTRSPLPRCASRCR